MSILFLNLPSPRPMARRWVASYYLPNFFMPPSELLSAASAVRSAGFGPVSCLDAMAEGLDEDACRHRLAEAAPDVVVTLLAFELFAEDLARLGRIVPGGCRVVALGYLAGLFPEATMDHGPVDAVIEGEAEEALPALLRSWKEGGDGSGLPGITVKGRGGPLPSRPSMRIASLDALPVPAWDLLDRSRYREPFFPAPFATVAMSRGCPHPCRFCVRSYGRKLISRSLASVKIELETLRGNWDYRCLRFMDDCLPLDRERFLDLCALLKDFDPLFTWSCLSRPDCLDEERVKAMAEAGCRRVYLGVESASPRLMTWLKKGYGPEHALKAARLCKAHGLEVSGYFIVGIPGERWPDLKASAELARAMDLDYAIVTRLQWWPGTELAESEGAPPWEDPFAGGSFPRDPDGPDPFEAERWLYRQIYLSPPALARALTRLIRHPLSTLRSAASFLAWLAHGRDGDFI